MKSADVTCKATNCIHNKNCECMAGVITVKGVHSHSTSETTCDTFVLEGGYTFDNLAAYNDDTKTVVELNYLKNYKINNYLLTFST